MDLIGMAGGSVRIKRIVIGFVVIVSLIFAMPAGAQPAGKATVAVLDFELHDLTLMPGMAEERERTASIAPMLRHVLETQYGVEIATVPAGAQAAADRASGYIFEHHDVAAELGRDAGSDWIVVGRVHKASFLFVYFKAQVINTRTERPIADLTVEVKGTQDRLTMKGVETLAEQIAEALNAT